MRSTTLKDKQGTHETHHSYPNGQPSEISTEVNAGRQICQLNGKTYRRGNGGHAAAGRQVPEQPGGTLDYLMGFLTLHYALWRVCKECR